MNEQNDTPDELTPLEEQDAFAEETDDAQADDLEAASLESDEAERDEAAAAFDNSVAAVGAEDVDAPDSRELSLSAEIDFEEEDEPVGDEDDAGEGEAEGDEKFFVVHDADAEDAAEEERLAREARALVEAVSETGGGGDEDDGDIAPGGGVREMAELMAIVEALIFVSDEPLTSKAMAELLGEERGWVEMAVEELAKEFNERQGGLMLREVAGGWQIATRPEHHEHVRAFLKSRPSAKLSLAALETLAVIAYKQPITIPEILEIRGVQSSSAIKTLLDKRLIVAKGRKETVGRPMMYGTSKEFLMQFGLRDLTELPSIEDFEDLAGSVA
ncbi:MAG TPA: SMC-Scp complex subunit ScpB [Pyrinomonadaceae bacterium]|nr:SMC-Scp complex subunit ScpB [Pyrinomonadaceae bacterium]